MSTNASTPTARTPSPPWSTILVDGSARGTLVVSGADRLRWLDAILTCDIAGLQEGRGAWGLLLNRQGKIVTDVVVIAARNDVFLSVAPGVAEEVCGFLDRMLVMEDAEISDRTGSYGWIGVHGAKASDVVARASARTPTVASARVAWVTGDDAVIVVSADAVHSELVALADADAGVQLASTADFICARLRHAWPQFGVDYGPDDNPHQAALEHRAVSWSKGCYLGQEVVCMVEMRGKVRRRIASVEFASPEAPDVGAPVCLVEGGESVGEVTTSAVCEGRGLALARVVRAAAEAQAEVVVQGLKGRLATTIAI